MPQDRTVTASTYFTRQRLLRWLILLLVILVISYFAWHKGQDFWDTLQKQWSEAHLNFRDFGYSWFMVGLVVYLISVLSTFIRWRVLLHALHIKCSYADAIRLGFVGYVGSMFLPGSTMGDAFKAGFVMRENPGNRVGALASIVVDRLVGLYSLFLLSALVGLMYLPTILAFEGPHAHELQIAFGVICAIALGGMVFYALFLLLPVAGRGYRQKLESIRFVGKLMSKVLGSLAQYRRYPWAMVQAVMIGMAGHVGFVLSYYFASRALPGPGPTPTWQMHFIVIPFFMVFQAVPLTPGGNLGVGDLILGRLYTIVGGLELKGILASLIQRLICWIVALIGLIWYLPLQQRFKLNEPVVAAADPLPSSSPAL